MAYGLLNPDSWNGEPIWRETSEEWKQVAKVKDLLALC